MSSFFCTKLQELYPEQFKSDDVENHRIKSKEEILKDSLRFVRKIDILSKNFIVIPIHENEHWMLAIVC